MLSYISKWYKIWRTRKRRLWKNNEEREKEDYEKILQKKKEQRMIKELEEKGYKIEIAS